MEPILVYEQLTNEIINEFRLPKTLCYEFIYNRIQRAHGAGYDLGRHTFFSTAKRVVQMDKLGNVIKVWNTAQEASRFYGMHKSGIARKAKLFHELAKKGKTHTIAGFVWKYENDKMNKQML